MDSNSSFCKSDQEILLNIAHDAIYNGLHNDRPAAVDPADYSAALKGEAASFVTLKSAGTLRGCIGSLEAVRPLVEDVNENAYAAAFRDPRFPPLSNRELEGLHISISVLSLPEAITFRSEQDLLEQLRAGIDGLILEEGRFRGTFLPAVWESLPNPQTFLRQLKLKAGLHPDYWSETLRVYRYHAEEISVV